MRWVLVTGAGGFIGGHLVARLFADGLGVRAMVRTLERTPWVRGPGVDLCVGDLTRPDTLAAAVVGVDTVFHCAAAVGGRRGSAADIARTNVEGTAHLLEACAAEPGIARIVHVSTVAVYGHSRRGEVATEDSVPAPRASDAYATTKLAAERAARDAIARRLPVVIARPMWVYGWRSPGVRRLVDLIAHRRMVLIGRGRNAIQPIAVDDLVDGLVRCATVPGVEGETFNFAGPVPMTTEQMCRDIADALGVVAPAWSLPRPVAMLAAALCEACYPRALGRPPIDRQKVSFFTLEHAYANNKAARLLGWRPETPFAEGARAMVRTLRAANLLA